MAVIGKGVSANVKVVTGSLTQRVILQNSRSCIIAAFCFIQSRSFKLRRREIKLVDRRPYFTRNCKALLNREKGMKLP